MANYTVQPGDFPIKIAERFGISFEDFSAMNPDVCQGTQWQTIYPGQVLNVPDGDAADDPNAVSEADQEVTDPLPDAHPSSSTASAVPPWMALANQEIGVREFDPGDNPRILQYLASVGLGGPDETAWCASFVNWCLKTSGYPCLNSGLAAAWGKFGRAVEPTYGAITVFQPLAAGASGHVGFLHAIVGDQIWMLSGNSSKQVRISPYSSSKLIQTLPFRWPV